MEWAVSRGRVCTLCVWVSVSSCVEVHDVKMSAGERERRLATIPWVFRMVLTDPLLYAHLETLLRAPSWDREAVLSWLFLVAMTDKKRLEEELRQVRLRQVAPMVVIPSDRH